MGNADVGYLDSDPSLPLRSVPAHSAAGADTGHLKVDAHLQSPEPMLRLQCVLYPHVGLEV